MKKALSFAVALGLVAGAAAVASAAELTITGDARLRGVYSQNTTDFTDHFDPAGGEGGNGQDTFQYMSQRYRFQAAVKVNDAVTVNTRLVVGNDEAGDMYFGNNVRGEKNTPELVADRANMVINTLGGTWTLGRQEAAWGNAPLPYLAKDVSVDRVKAIYKTGGLTYGAYLQKNEEGLYNNGDGDKNAWGALVIGKAGATTWGVLLNYITANDTAAKNSGKDTGSLVDPYFMTTVGPATILGEFLYKGGDLGKRNDKAQYGGYVAGVVDLAPVTLTGLLAYSKNGCTADSHFAPSMLIGKTNETAMINFGDRAPFGDASINDSSDRSYIVGGVASLKASDKLTFGAVLAYLGATKHGFDDQKASLVELDLTGEYELAQNAKYKLGVAFGDPNKLSAKDDMVFVVGNAVEVAW